MSNHGGFFWDIDADFPRFANFVSACSHFAADFDEHVFCASFGKQFDDAIDAMSFGDRG